MRQEVMCRSLILYQSIIITKKLDKRLGYTLAFHADKIKMKSILILLLSAGLILVLTAPFFLIAIQTAGLTLLDMEIFPIGENMYLYTKDATVNPDDNAHLRTVTLVNKDGVCTVGFEWEVKCERWGVRNLKGRFFHDKDWPTEKDYTVQGGKI
jgi:hypothetical protein